VDPNLPAVEIVLAPSSSTAKIQVPAVPLERQVGKAVAMTASAIAAGVRDYANGGGMTVATKTRVATLFTELFELRCLTVGAWNFDAIAHQQGRLALAEACGHVNAAEQAIIDELINTVMDVLRKVVRSQAN
jgi:hypothetical protein